MSEQDTKLQIIVGNYRYSSWSLRGWLAVMHSNLPHDTVRVPLFTEEALAKLQGVSPTGQVPCLVDPVHGSGTDPVIVWDSLAIIDYLAKLTPDQYWWPEDPAGYGFARSIVAEMHSGFTALRSACPMNLGKSYKGLEMAPKLAKDVARVDSLWKEARTRFGLQSAKPGPFLFGAWSAADMMFAPVVTRAMTYGLPMGSVAKAYMAAVDSYAAMDHWRKAAQLETDIIEKYDDVASGGLLGADL